MHNIILFLAIIVNINDMEVQFTRQCVKFDFVHFNIFLIYEF